MHQSLGTGEPVVFVHGNGSTHETWAQVVAPLSRHHRCITYDLRGHGGPPLGAQEPSLDRFVDDLEALVAELGLSSLAVIGHSLGAFIAAAYALRHPQAVRALGLLAAPAARDLEAQAAGARLVEDLRRDGVQAVMGRLTRFWYTDGFLADHPEALRERLAQIETIADDVFIRTYALYNRTEIAPWLPRLAMPTLVMTGEFARGCGAEVARTIAAALPDASLVVFEGMKNGILTEIPGKVAQELHRFLSSTRGP